MGRQFFSIFLGFCLIGWSWVLAPAPAVAMGGTQPPIGSPAPEFTLPTNSGDGDVSLADFRNQWVVLYFYPRDFTSG